MVIPASGDAPSAALLPDLRGILQSLRVTWELLVVTATADALISHVVPEAGGELLIQTEPGYGGALLTGFSRARGRYVLTMDADVAGPPTMVQDLWAARETADVVIASRYVQGGHARMPRDGAP